MTVDTIMLYRLLDANLNRAVEGLRVLEECARMLLNDAALTTRIKDLRHRTTALIRTDPILDRNVLFARDTASDVLNTGATALELKRDDLASLLRANARRAAEAVRALEEYSKLISPDMAVACKDIRFEIYAVEKDAITAITRISLLGPDRIRLGLDIDCARDADSVSEQLDSVHAVGTGMVLLRAGALNDCKFFEVVKQAACNLDRSRITLLVYGRADIACAADADGVILGDGGLRPADARKIIGPGRVIGYVVTSQKVPETDHGGMIDFKIMTHDAVSRGDLPDDHVKPRLITGVSNIETLSSLPSDAFDGILLTPDGTPDDTIALTHAARALVGHFTEDNSDVPHDLPGRKKS